MSAPLPGDAPAWPSSLQQRIRRLREAVNAQIVRQEKKRIACLVGGAVLTVAFLTSLVTLTSITCSLDAQALTEIGRHKVERNLPRSRHAAKQLLEAKAPELTSHLLETLKDVLPMLRPIVVNELEAKLRIITSHFERDLQALMESSIRSTREELQVKLAGVSDDQKIEILVSIVAERFRENMKGAYATLYADYTREMDRVEGYLKGIRFTKPELLTARERLDKEIIQTLLKLITREQAGARAGI